MSIHSTHRFALSILLIFMAIMISAAYPHATVAFEIVHPMISPTIQSWHTDAEAYMRIDTALPSSFTGQTVIEIGKEFLHAIDQFTMLGISSAPNIPPDMLSLVWEKDPNSWWVAWRLTLKSGPDVIINGKAGAEIELIRTTPTSHHTYETNVSYDEQTKVLSIAVINTTSDEIVSQQFFQVQFPSTRLWLHSGGHPQQNHANDEAIAHIHHINLLEHYIPVGVRWNRIIENPAGSTLPGRRMNSNDTVAISLQAPSLPSRSSFRITVIDTDTENQALTFEHVIPEQSIRIAAEDLPFGTMDIVLEYVTDNTVYFRDTKPLQVGYIDVVYDKAVPDFENNVLHGVVHITAPADVTNIPIQLTASIEELVWDDAIQKYEMHTWEKHDVYDDDITLIGTEKRSLPFSIPLPEQSGTWQLDLSLQTPIPHNVQKKSQYSLFSTAHLGAVGNLRICSYNIYGFDGWPEEIARQTLGSTVNEAYFVHFSDVIHELNCDIIGLQEAHSSEWLRILSARTDNNVAISSTRTSFPGGILTRFPIVETRDYASGPPSGNVPFSRTAGAALLDIDGNHVWVVNIHAHPNREDLRKEEARLLGEYVDELAIISPHIVVVGDFNSIPGTIIHQALTNRGFLNAMELGADRYYPTMNQRSGGTGVRAIDHIYVSESLIGTVRNSTIYDAPGFRMPNIPEPDSWLHSDHLPVITEIEW